MLSAIVLVLTSMTTFLEYRAMQYHSRAIATLTCLPLVVIRATSPAIFGCVLGVILYLFSAWKDSMILQIVLCAIVGVSFGGLTVAFTQRVNVFCPHCDMYVERSKDWICGYCKKTNEDSIFGRCSTCERKPTGYVCVHCREAVPLNINGKVDEKHLAMHKDMPAEPEPEKQPEVTELRKEEKEQREHEIMMTRLNAQLKAEEANLERVIESTKKPQKKSAEDEFTEHHENFMRVQEIAEREIAAIKQKFKNNPELQQRFIESIEIWRNERM